MTCTVEREPLVEAVAALAKVAGGREYHETWQSIKLQALRGRLILSATDGNLWLTLDVEAKGDLDPICVSALRFKDAVTSMSGELIGLQLDEAWLKLAAGGGRRKLPTASADDFPSREFEPAERFTLEAKAIAEAVTFTGSHVADISDHARAQVAAVFLFSDEGRLKAIGTDGAEIAMIDVGSTPGRVEAAVPQRVAELAASLMRGAVELGLSERAVEFRWSNGRILGPLLENAIPVETLLRATKKNLAFEKEGAETFPVSVETSTLIAALRGVRALGDTDSASKGRRVKMTLNGTAQLSTQSPEGSAEEVFPADLSEARELEIGFSSSRMERVLRGFGDSVLTITLRDPGSPMKFEAAGQPDRVKLLYPMRV